jgi:predicted MFS family arabinose efflux permease
VVTQASAPAAAPDETVGVSVEETQASGARRMFAAFTHRDFRIQWFGACTSSIGTWMQIVAQNWLVLSLTNSAFFLGLDSFLQQLPIILLTLVGGVVADRYDRRKTLIASQYVQMATSGTLALLMYFHVVQIWHILALSFTTGLAQAFGGPSYQSLIPSLVGKKDLPNAIALNSIQFNVARVLGPLAFGLTLAGFTHHGYSEPQAMNACFVLNSLSFIVVINTLMALRVKHIPPTSKGRVSDELKSGFRFVRTHHNMAALMTLAALTTFLGFSLITFLPVMAKEVFHEGPDTYSWMMAFSGAGSVVGALLIAYLGKYKRMGMTALTTQAIYGALIIAFALSRVLLLSDVLLFLTGATLMIVFSTITSLVQLAAPDNMRGRVMSIHLVAFRGGMPLGSLASGSLADFIGAPIVIAINGILLVIVAVYFLVLDHGVRDA